MTDVLETGADKLLALVEQKREISAKHASRILNIEVATIERWSEAMEEEGLIKSRHTIKDKILIHPEYFEIVSGKKTLFKDMIFFSFRDHNEEVASKKEKALKREYILFEEKLKELKNFEKEKEEVRQREKALNEEKALIDKKARQAEHDLMAANRALEAAAKKERQTEKLSTSLADRERKASESLQMSLQERKIADLKLSQIASKEKLLHIKEKELSAAAAALEKRSMLISFKESEVKKLHKEISSLRDILGQKEAWLSKKAASLKNAARDVSIRKGELILTKIEIQKMRAELAKIMKTIDKKALNLREREDTIKLLESLVDYRKAENL